MEQFLADVATALIAAGLPELESENMARLAVSEIETTLLRPANFASRLALLKGRYRETLEAARSRQIGRLLVTPIPGYLLPALPDLVAEFPTVVFADNLKAGGMIAGRPCITLDEALADQDGFDACLLGTVDQRLGRLFRDRLPADRTIAAAELAWFDPIYRARPMRPALTRFHQAIRASPRPLLVLTAYIDVTFGPTLEALGREGFDIFIITRRSDAEDESHAASPEILATSHHFLADLDEMLWLLRHSGTCPLLMNYARFLPTNWDMRNTIPLFAYSIATARAATGPHIVHLYDAYQVCTDGLEIASLSFALYFALLERADGILVNADVVPLLKGVVGPHKPIISFLRYGPEAAARPEPEPGPFSIAMITSFLGETSDPTRMTADAVRSLLHQGIHVHYYSLSPASRAFAQTLTASEADCFHLHAPIPDQAELIAEMSRWHAGWFVADMASFEHLGKSFPAGIARDIADDFVSSAVATASIWCGCAGLPSFFHTGLYTATLFPPGTAIEIDLPQVERLGDMIGARDWTVLRRSMFAARQDFGTDKHIGRLVDWLDQFYFAPYDSRSQEI